MILVETTQDCDRDLTIFDLNVARAACFRALRIAVSPDETRNECLTMPRITSSSDMADAILPLMASIWRYALSLSGARDLADDLTQATVLRAMEKHHQFEQESNLSAWCLTICRSIWLNQMRAQALRKSQSLASVPEIEDMSVTGRAETNVFVGEVIQKVMELPEAQRETVVLVYVEGFKYSEAAEILGIPIGTVMSRLSAARSSLKHLGNASSGQKSVGAR